MKRWFTVCLMIMVGFSGMMLAREYQGKAAQRIDRDAKRVFVSDETRVPRRIYFRDDVSVQREGFFRRYAAAMPHDQVVQARQLVDDLGMIHTRYQQYHKGLKVIGAEYILHERNGRVVSANGYLQSDLDIDVQPQLSEREAFQIALNRVGGTLYKWQTEPELFQEPRGELVITSREFLMTKESYRLAYRFEIYAEQPLGRFIVDVDARTGDILNFYNRIHTVNVAATGTSLYNGTVSFTADQFGPSSYRLRQTVSGNGIETYDMQNGTNYNAAVDVTSSSTHFSGDPTAVNAHWGAEQTHAYYLNRHGRNSYDGNGAVIRSYVHYSVNYNNAFWDGQRMTYGDGDGSTFSPLVSIDVVGHEITHGVTEHSANLVYSYESGALNESFSDIFGEAIENYATGSNDWLIGDDIDIQGNGIRNMSNPNEDGDPDTYHGTYWYSGSGDNGGVHTNSGVQNFWFYLLVNGGSGVNDNGFSYNVSGIGLVDAAAIAYRNLTVYLTTNSNYSDAYLGSLDAATDLFGFGSAQYNSVSDAWDAVGVDDSNAGGGSNPGGGGGCLAPLSSFIAKQYLSLDLRPNPRAVEYANKIVQQYDQEMQQVYAVLAAHPRLQRDLYQWVRSARPFIEGGMTLQALDKQARDKLVDLVYRVRSHSKDLATRDFLFTVARTLETGETSVTYAQLLERVFNRLTIEPVEAASALKGDGEQARTFHLAQNYPNPFNPTTTVAFYLPEEAHVRLTVYDATGKQVAVLMDEKLPAGEKYVTWDAHNFASGIYFLKMEAGSFTRAIKMMLMK
ncbi:MAG: T9SS C-terminal target domain-containing protein [Calditrichaeota bacterium]|nr:MAG: T9SS C-terminal target domain-containing protein [Calditrichota bacterium]